MGDDHWQTAAIIKEIPQIIGNSTSNGDKGKKADVFGAHDEREGDASCN
jgi:hypothetical protein